MLRRAPLDRHPGKEGWDDLEKWARTECPGWGAPSGHSPGPEPQVKVEEVLSTWLLLELSIVTSGLIPGTKYILGRCCGLAVKKRCLGRPYPRIGLPRDKRGMERSTRAEVWGLQQEGNEREGCARGPGQSRSRTRGPDWSRER